MTLTQFLARYPYRPTYDNGAVLALPDSLHPSRVWAWALIDARVTSVSGGSLWLRRQEE